MFSSTNPTTVAATQPPRYDHTQTGPLCWLLLLPIMVLLPVMLVLTNEPAGIVVILIVDMILIAAALSFRSLRIVDEGNTLALRYGPLPLFKKRLAYADMLAAERDRTTPIDGWGIHWIPGRGWTYNLWGYDCVRLTLQDGRTIRLGTNDPNGLEEFLRKNIPGERGT